MMLNSCVSQFCDGWNASSRKCRRNRRSPFPAEVFVHAPEWLPACDLKSTRCSRWLSALGPVIVIGKSSLSSLRRGNSGGSNSAHSTRVAHARLASTLVERFAGRVESSVSFRRHGRPPTQLGMVGGHEPMPGHTDLERRNAAGWALADRGWEGLGTMGRP